MFARWVQIGLWSPILRLHCSFSAFNSREPWRYNSETDACVTHSLQFRHRLIPYLYTMSVRAAREGRCIVEPMYHQYPIEAGAYANKTQYFFGTQLLVAPIVEKRSYVTMMGASDVWLPKGQWIDIFTNTVYDGDRSIKMYRPIEGTPVLTRPGAIIPLDLAGTKGFDAETVNSTPIPTAIEIILVVGADGAFELLEDDGKGSDLEAIHFSKTRIVFNQTSGRLTIGPTLNPLVENRQYRVRLPAFEQSPNLAPTISSSGGSIKSITTDKAQTVLNMGPTAVKNEITVELGQSPKLRQNDIASATFAILDKSQMDPDVKDRVYELFEHGVSASQRHVILSRLESFDLDAFISDALKEHLMA